MFTGIVTEIGMIKSFKKAGHGACLGISSSSIIKDVKIGDSVSVNGVCLTVNAVFKEIIKFDVIQNTLLKTNLKRFKIGGFVNLEGALKLGDKISGHFVSGHIDAERMILEKSHTRQGCVLKVKVTEADSAYLVPRGSVAIDGVSLTINDVNREFFSVCLIPLTLEQTILKFRKTGDFVNLEFDMTAKYNTAKPKNKITMETLKMTGFID
ncbi:Lumazine-binding protein [Candidatus Omnitrophus magneticus]|uniref:Riboflavin synthase n=1 Tax=Candidatus Omnitrophus magneticus TaxID=1609969 RepID=A0A0F0CST5_9BACT|nr:Lumazine-binding protein [Candidatus Omnitrophus magneticus]